MFATPNTYYASMSIQVTHSKEAYVRLYKSPKTFLFLRFVVYLSTLAEG